MVKSLERARKTKVVTQNKDVGRKVYLKRKSHRNYCMNCGKFYDAQYVKKVDVPKCPAILSVTRFVLYGF